MRAPHVLIALHRRELLFQLRDAITYFAPVQLEPGFARPTASLPLFATRRLSKAWRRVVQSRDLDLQSRFTALGVPMKDLDDDAGAIEHLHARRALEVARLTGRQIMIHRDEIDLRHRLTIAVELRLGPVVVLLSLLLVLRPMVLRLGLQPKALLAGAVVAGGELMAGSGTMIGGAMGIGALAGGGQGGSGPAHADTAALSAPHDTEELVMLANVDGALRASSVRRVSALVDSHPEQSLTVLRSWMIEEAA